LTALLSVSRLGILRGERVLVRDLDFALNARDCLLVEGPNGSGKTSLLRVLAGLGAADSGDILWRGRPTRQSGQAFRAELAWLGHRGGLKQDLTPLENLAADRALRPAGRRDADEVMRRLGIATLTELPLRVLSAGQQRRVALARLMLAEAALWLLDEPFTNLDRAGQALVNELIAEHLAGGGLAIVASHRGMSPELPTRTISLS